jgi:mannosyltransferase OCH1-like enzyme
LFNWSRIVPSISALVSYTFTMRRGLLIFCLVNLLILSLLVRSVSTLLSLLVEDAAADAIHRAELPSPNSSLIEQRPQIIPKIIHQTYKNETIPEVWVEAQQSCIDLHPDYEYIVCPAPTSCSGSIR